MQSDSVAFCGPNSVSRVGLFIETCRAHGCRHVAYMLQHPLSENFLLNFLSRSLVTRGRLSRTVGVGDFLRATKRYDLSRAHWELVPWFRPGFSCDGHKINRGPQERDDFLTTVSVWEGFIRGVALDVSAASESTCLNPQLRLTSSSPLSRCGTQTAADLLVLDLEYFCVLQLDPTSCNMISDSLTWFCSATARIVKDAASRLILSVLAAVGSTVESPDGVDGLASDRFSPTAHAGVDDRCEWSEGRGGRGGSMITRPVCLLMTVVRSLLLLNHALSV